MKIPGTSTDLFGGMDEATVTRVLAEMRALDEAHVHSYVNVGTQFENKYTGSCSCGTWAAAARPLGQLRLAFDEHLAGVYAAHRQARCFCKRLVFESPLRPGVWVHADYSNDYYAHDPLVLP